MTNNNRYVGQVVKTKENFGFIGLETVRNLDGSPAELSATKDIFVHCNSILGNLRVGMELTFCIRSDFQREGELRADDVLLSGIELHFLDRVIDHPSVPVSWCIKPEAIEVMRNLAADDYYVVIAARERGTDGKPWCGDRKKTTIETIIGLDRIKDGRGYLNFYAPGTYEVFTYLVKSEVTRERLVKSLSDIETRRFEPINEYKGVQIDDRSDLPFLRQGEKFDRAGTVIGISQLSLEVPDGIFAKPLTGWKKQWFCYFWNEDLLDDCDRRSKQWFAFTAGVPWFVCWEGLKRSWMLMLSVAHFLKGGSPLTLWKRAFARRLSSTISGPFGDYEYEEMMDFSGRRALLRPIFPSLLLAFVVANFYAAPLREITYTGLRYGGIVFAVIIVALILLLVAMRFLPKDGRTAEEVAADRLKRITAEKKQRLDALLGEVEVYAACGTAPSERPASVRLIFSGVKRMVCRNYRKA